MSILRTETRITSNSTGGSALSVQHWAGIATADPATLLLQAEEARDRLEAAWGALTGDLHSSARVFCAERVVVVDTVPPQLVPIGAPVPIAGTDGLAPLPWATQGIVTLRDGSASRGGRGRIFVPCLTEDSNDAGVPTAALIGSLTNFVNALQQPLGATALNLVLFHRATGTATNVGSAQVRNYFAYLGSRRD